MTHSQSAAKVARVARRFLASLADQLESRVEAILRDPSPEAGKAMAGWLADNFAFQGAKTPRGGKELKELLKAMHWCLHAGLSMGPSYAKNIEKYWADLKPHRDQLVRLFTLEGGVDVPKELQRDGRVYLNLSGFSAATLAKYAEALEAVWKELKGWRRKALAGTLKVALAGPSEFRGTAAGVYRSEQDTLYVRATPKILNRTKGTYGALDYILVHELGHRYEYKFHPKEDFDRQEWRTSRYSRNDGEGFAELFALSNFGLKGSWNPDVLDRFDSLMTGGTIPEFPSMDLPEHLKGLSRGR